MKPWQDLVVAVLRGRSVRPLLPTLVLAGLSLHGATMTWEQSYEVAREWGSDFGIAKAIYVPKFDPTQGTLTRFSLSVTVRADGDMRFVTGGQGGRTESVEAAIGFYVNLSPTASAFEDIRRFYGPTFTLTTVGNTEYVFPNAINGGTVVSNPCFAYCKPSDITGSGTVDYLLYISELRNPWTNIYVPYTASGLVTANAVATYEYESPEPSSWVLMALGIAGLGYHYRRGRPVPDMTQQPL